MQAENSGVAHPKNVVKPIEETAEFLNKTESKVKIPELNKISFVSTDDNLAKDYSSSTERRR